MTELSTIGYEGASLDDFIATVHAAGVRQVLDVRELPQSRRPGFSKNILANALLEHDISYLHFKLLGDPKHGREAARSGRMSDFVQIYHAHIERPEATNALRSAVEAAQETSSVLMCFERNPQHCHRSLLAQRMIVLYPFRLRHLGVMDGAAARALRANGGAAVVHGG